MLNTSTQEHTGHRDVFSTTLRSDKQWVLGEAFFFCSQIWKEDNVNKLEKTKLLSHMWLSESIVQIRKANAGWIEHTLSCL